MANFQTIISIYVKFCHYVEQYEAQVVVNKKINILHPLKRILKFLIYFFLRNYVCVFNVYK